ncbi:unnamed protein product [Parascedosporium putredinis]|uniref:ABC transporter domain-containing protein n=1 Tax=Parascedosporium putredinis TaxID=1442378 RepID=A0A9P1MA49_9PEZI|nr:unnamed protein product [Parascedosporium putredinis]CAI7993397.1 unnamed protein product [Parascedosporium putredinis]
MQVSDSEGTLGDLISTPPNGRAKKNEKPTARKATDQFHSSSDTDVDVEVEAQDDNDSTGKDYIQKKLTLTFKSVTVLVKAAEEALGETLWSRVDPTQLVGLRGGRSLPKRAILSDVTGQVNPGRCEVQGEVRYGSMTHKQARGYRQQIVFNTEDDIHFPTMTVNQTMKFALKNKVPRDRPAEVEKKNDFVKGKRTGILDALGIGHTQKTLVGNEFIRGVSGGERKRVSLAEVMASQSPVQFWDQPTRGLDSKTALEFAATLREQADRNGRTVVATMYQAGNGIYDKFDKVLVLAEGRVIYYGPRVLAKSYFENLGFEGRVPTTPAEFEAVYKRSERVHLLRPGILFFPVLYFLLESMSETTASFMGRPILVRHKRFGFYRPAAFCIANAITDIPVVMLQVTCFSLIIYFMASLQLDAGRFFTFWIIVNASTLCFVQLFRMVGALFSRFGTASQVSGLLSTVFFVYSGYLIPFEKMHVWFRWIFYLNPGAYAFESLVANEFGGLSLECVAPQYIPYGPGYDGQPAANRGCTVIGSSPDGIINGEEYIFKQNNYSTGHIWRGFGVLVGFWIFFIAVTALGFELRNSQNGSSVLLYKRNFRNKTKVADAEAGAVSEKTSAAPAPQEVKQSTFSWHDLDYFVKYHGEQKQLLNKVFGYVKPGNLVALMGCSGAGKTTLLDVLAQRKDAGEIRGSILIDGKPQGISFQRMTGYCEQMDVHEATATVREALVFSALLRQPREVSESEKMAYVDHIIELLELQDIKDALIGIPGAGLSIEQRKRVTLGVELVAKPTLLFLDEPTSGLDGQSAYNIIRFLRSPLRASPTNLDVPAGENSATVLNYFSRNGAPCPDEANPAEHIVETIQGNTELPIDWVDVWSKSSECQEALKELKTIDAMALQGAQGEEDTADFATSKWFQFRMVLHRLMIQLWRSPVSTFVHPQRVYEHLTHNILILGLPILLHNRDLFETREKKSKTYHWLAFIGAQTVSEIPYLIICATLYFACWYFTAGFPVEAKISGHMYLQMIFYEFLYTSLGQAIAAYAPNEYGAAILNPIIIGAGMISFCGVVVPYSLMQPFWKYWLYYLDPFHYLVGGLFGTVVWDVQVQCRPEELTTFEPPSGLSCGQYMSDFLAKDGGYVVDANATSACQYCPYSTGADYAKSFNINEAYYPWRDVEDTDPAGVLASTSEVESGFEEIVGRFEELDRSGLAGWQDGTLNPAASIGRNGESSAETLAGE